MKQVILGAGGDIGTLLAKELKQYTHDIRLVSRTPGQVTGGEELFPANLLDKAQADRAVAGTGIAYLTAGLKYDRRIWKKYWPLIIENVINACIKHGTRLVFFDNVYMYDKTAIPHMTEESPLNPPSKKGQVRQQVVQAIETAIAARGLKALIARSADFYGPGSRNGILNTLVLHPLARNKKPNWQANADKIHSFTYTIDAARATALLGNTDSAFGQVWHLPTSSERWTGRQFIAKAAEIKDVKPSYTLLRPFMLSLAGLFNRTIFELVEMQYQNDQDYFFESRKFCDTFKFTPTSYEEGMREVFSMYKK